MSEAGLNSKRSFTGTATDDPPQQVWLVDLIQSNMRSWPAGMPGAHFLHAVKQFFRNDRLMTSLPQLIAIRHHSVEEFILEEIGHRILAPLVSLAGFETAFVQKVGNRLVRSVPGSIQFVGSLHQLRFLLYDDDLVLLLVLDISKGNRSILNSAARHRYGGEK